jgi:hypothetical protein
MYEAEPRFVGLDLHRHDVMVGAVNAHQDIVLTPQRVTLRQFTGLPSTCAPRIRWPSKPPPTPGCSMT